MGVGREESKSSKENSSLRGGKRDWLVSLLGLLTSLKGEKGLIGEEDKMGSLVLFKDLGGLPGPLLGELVLRSEMGFLEGKRRTGEGKNKSINE